jgi:hypothetical protein
MRARTWLPDPPSGEVVYVSELPHGRPPSPDAPHNGPLRLQRALDGALLQRDTSSLLTNKTVAELVGDLSLFWCRQIDERQIPKDSHKVRHVVPQVHLSVGATEEIRYLVQVVIQVPCND